MAMNRIQFQRGMSLPEFHRRFGTKQQRAEAVMRRAGRRAFAALAVTNCQSVPARITRPAEARC